ncbi:hypothetical protein B0T13DRAFT_59182 [Neurospora crassa]|nr:hypothetical protein B0T13DRAFT_59182 [Neurospora crassa]
MPSTKQPRWYIQIPIHSPFLPRYSFSLSCIHHIFPFPFPFLFFPPLSYAPLSAFSPPFPSPIPFFCVALPLNQPKRHRVTMKTEDRHHAMPSVHRVLNRGCCKMSIMLEKEKKKMEQRQNYVDRDVRRHLYANRNRTPSKCCRLLLLRAFPSLGRRGKSPPSPLLYIAFLPASCCSVFFVPFLFSVSCACTCACACLCSPFCQCGWSGEPLLFSSKMQSRQKM